MRRPTPIALGLNLTARVNPIIQWFCRCLIKSAGKRIKTPPLSMEVRRDISGWSPSNPHNALADAYALRDEWRSA